MIRINIRSLKTFVPPVTALRSPPLSRITGADSPVIADSSTLAIPSIISPSPGIVSPASQTTISPFRKSVAFAFVSKLFLISLATVEVLDFLRLAAWALPRPSAMLSAKLAKMTVNHSQTEIWISKPLCKLSAKITMSVVSIAQTSVTNMTGFLACTFGDSFKKESLRAGSKISESRKFDFLSINTP